MHSNCIDSFTLPNLSVVPSEPQQLEILIITSNSVTLQWMPPNYPNGVIIQYSIEYDGKSINVFGDDESNKITGTIEELLPNTNYIIKVKAYTRIGPGPPVSLLVRICKLLNMHSCTCDNKN